MSKNSPVQTTVSPALELERAVYFVSALYSLIRLAICSRIGSVLLDQAATSAIQLLRDSFPSHDIVQVRLTGNRLVVQDQELSLDHEDIVGVYRFLSALQIAGLDINRTIAHRQMLQFVKGLLNWRISVFRDPQQQLFPPKLSGVEMIAEHRDGPAISARPDCKQYSLSTGVVDGICSEIRMSGVDKAVVMQVHDYLLETLQYCEKTPAPAFPYLCWRDVVMLLHKVASVKAISNRNIKANSVLEYECRSLAEVFDSLARDNGGSASGEILHVLLEYLLEKQMKISGTVKKAAVARRKPQRRKNTRITVGTIRQFVNEYKIPGRRIEPMFAHDNRELLSVLLQRLACDCSENIEQRGGRLIQSLLQGKVFLGEWESLLGFLEDFTGQGDVERCNWLFPQILQGLRAKKKGNSLELCVDLWPKLSVKKQLLVWPHVVHELLLVGADNQLQDTFFSATGIASHQPLVVMQGCQNMLEGMPVWRDRTLAETVFRASYIYSYPLFSFLLSTSIRDSLAEKVIAQLKDEPQDEFIAAVVPFLRSTRHEHVSFVQNYLRYAIQDDFPPVVKSAAGRIIVYGLQELSDLNKKKPWVVDAILKMAELRVEDTRDMLEKIRSDKRIGLLPLWPKECRRAAEIALQQLIKVDMRLKNESVKYS